MLVRSAAAGQTLPIRRLLVSGPLHLSTRCCVANLARPLAGTRRLVTASNDSRPWKQKTFRALDGFERNLATAVEEHRFGDEIPFDGLPAGLNPPLYELQPFDATSPLVPREPPSYPTRARADNSGIPGDLDELLSLFEACVHVGRMDRAALVLKRLLALGVLSPDKQVEVHNRYLQGRVAQLIADPDPAKGEQIHEWFELYIQDPRLPYTPVTLAYMLKTTLLTSRSVVRRNRVERYMSMLSAQGTSEALDLGDVLDDNDLATIAAITPAYSFSEHETLSEDASDDTADAAAHVAANDVESQLPETWTGVPEVLSTPQKGFGLSSLKTTLTLFSELPDGFDIANLPVEVRREIQDRLERDCVDAAISRWRQDNEKLKQMGLNTALATPTLNSKLYVWHQALEARIAEEQAKVEVSESAPKKSLEDLDRCTWGPLLLQSSPSRLAAVTVLSMLSLFAVNGADKGVPISNCAVQIGKLVEEDIRSQKITLTGGKARSKFHASAQRLLTSVPSKPQTDFLETEWSTSVRAKIGSLLVASLIDSAKVTVQRENPETGEKIYQSQAAFIHTMQLRKGKKIGVLLPNRNLVEMMKREPRGEALARHLPMVVEPEPWTKFDQGGFIGCKVPIIRLKNHEVEQKFYAEAAIERGDMEQMMRGLDVLGKTAWKINRPVFDVMLEAWNTGEAFADFPPLDPKIQIPPEPESTDDPMVKRQWLKEVRAVENEKSGMHSVRCFINFQLEIARAFRDQTFYFPHNIDFRGRAYPIPTYLNHMGADHMRGLLIFAKGKPLGQNGLRWLKVHLANVYGYDKASLEEREYFATENWDNIVDSVENPLNGKRWWVKAEDPWQCLATCFEIKAALESQDPTAYVSHLPVHQDGTCNGLQHYAALGGDTWGAQQVNLIPGERPADVYSAVAGLVQDLIAKEKEEGKPLAMIMDGKISRKVVKQTVMTNVYGVTYVGAKKQVQKQLDALYPDLEKQTGYSSRILSAYVAAKIFVALSSMFRGAHDIQNWLGEIGSRVCRALMPEQIRRMMEPPQTKLPQAVDVAESKTEGEESGKKKRGRPRKVKEVDVEALEDVEGVKKRRGRQVSGKEDDLAAQFRNTLVWTTPLRMPVVQPYRKTAAKIIKTCLQDLALTISGRDDPVNRRKQLQAFPPNFIHSLDASHMMLSALECNDLGLTFAAVHDSFWTHAADVDAMNRVLRDAFIRIHSEDVIGRLKCEFEARYRNALYQTKVVYDTPVGQEISAWRKKHRTNLNDEALLELRRQELLRSDDPEEVARGKKMVTPASIFESMATPDVEVSEYDAVGSEADEGADDDVDEVLEHPRLMKAMPGVLNDPEASSERAAEVYGKDVTDLLRDNFFVAHLKNRFKQPSAARKHEVPLWLPFSLPAIPVKGDFDVTKLRESKYFFS
ncbi:hypothetical protein VTK26DRAFT_4384 [Humicola hyalothermophila]